MASDQDWQPVVLRKSNSIAKTAKSATELNTAMRKGEVEAVRKVTHTANPNARKVCGGAAMPVLLCVFL